MSSAKLKTKKKEAVHAKKALGEIETHSVKDTTVRFIEKFEPGYFIRQGDIQVERVSDLTPKGKAIPGNKLAEGETKGARHFVEGDYQLYLSPENKRTDPLQGPILVAKSRVTITHPEHADHSIPAGCYSVTYPNDFAKEERQRRMD